MTKYSVQVNVKYLFLTKQEYLIFHSKYTSDQTILCVICNKPFNRNRGKKYNGFNLCSDKCIEVLGNMPRSISPIQLEENESKYGDDSKDNESKYSDNEVEVSDFTYKKEIEQKEEFNDRDYDIWTVDINY